MSAGRGVQERAAHATTRYSMRSSPGRSFNAPLIGRLFGWVRPHWRQAVLSGVLVLVASVLAILMPVDRLARRDRRLLQAHRDRVTAGLRHERRSPTGSAHRAACPHLLVGVCVVHVASRRPGRSRRTTTVLAGAKSVLNALRDLRFDLFSHLETRPASFYDHVAVGRVMTRVTNDIEVLFQLLSRVRDADRRVRAVLRRVLADARDRRSKLTGILLLAVPVVALATYLFRRGTRTVYRAIRQSISQLNQNLQENLSGIQVVQLNRREDRNLARYTQINQENRREENRAVEIETFYGAFIDSLGSAAVGVIIWFGGGHVLQQTISLGSVVLFTQFVDMLFRPIVARRRTVQRAVPRDGERANGSSRRSTGTSTIHEPAVPATLPARLRGRGRRASPDFAYANGPAC